MFAFLAGAGITFLASWWLLRHFWQKWSAGLREENKRLARENEELVKDGRSIKHAYEQFQVEVAAGRYNHPANPHAHHAPLTPHATHSFYSKPVTVSVPVDSPMLKGMTQQQQLDALQTLWEQPPDVSNFGLKMDPDDPMFANLRNLVGVANEAEASGVSPEEPMPDEDAEDDGPPSIFD